MLPVDLCSTQVKTLQSHIVSADSHDSRQSR